jgi:hypothetical protein
VSQTERKDAVYADVARDPSGKLRVQCVGRIGGTYMDEVFVESSHERRLGVG